MDGHRAPLAYHARLIADPHRLEAYDRALRRLVRPGDVVLDLGTGTGVLAMLAARRGARVHAIESTPVIAIAEELAARNGLCDRIKITGSTGSRAMNTVDSAAGESLCDRIKSAADPAPGRIRFHRGDARFLDPVEPVDWVVSDFLGCFLADDNMLPAVEAAGRWLKPAGRFVPSRVRLYLAPVVDLTFGDAVFDESPLGLDLSAARAYATPALERVNVLPSLLASAPRLFHDFAPPGPPAPFDAQLAFRLERGGTLAGLCGWFVADLADDVTLSNGPGIETHWFQLLFRTPPTPVLPGDDVVVHLHQIQGDGDWWWGWAGTVTRGGTILARYAAESEEWLGERQPIGRPLDGDAQHAGDAEAAYEAGNAAFEAGRIADAIAQYSAATRALTPEADALAPELFENLGIALWRAGRWQPAARAFLRALDGGTSREQSLRLLVGCFFRAGRPIDGETWLRRYEAVYGPHPEGWTRSG